MICDPSFEKIGLGVIERGFAFVQNWVNKKRLKIFCRDFAIVENESRVFFFDLSEIDRP